MRLCNLQLFYLRSPNYFGVKLNSLLTAHVTQVENEVGEIVMCIVQNKIDLIDEACITP